MDETRHVFERSWQGRNATVLCRRNHGHEKQSVTALRFRPRPGWSADADTFHVEPIDPQQELFVNG